MTHRQVRLSFQAREDLERISDPLHTAVLDRLELLSRFPDLGAPMTDAFAGWRSTVVRLFRIIYRTVPAGHVEIGYIRHGHRQLP